MVWWWIGNLLLILVVAPTCLFFLNLVLRQIMEVKSYADDVLEHGVALTGTLDAVEKLAATRQLTSSARQSAGRYAAALQRLV